MVVAARVNCNACRVMHSPRSSEGMYCPFVEEVDEVEDDARIYAVSFPEVKRELNAEDTGAGTGGETWSIKGWIGWR